MVKSLNIELGYDNRTASIALYDCYYESLLQYHQPHTGITLLAEGHGAEVMSTDIERLDTYAHPVDTTASALVQQFWFVLPIL